MPLKRDGFLQAWKQKSSDGDMERHMLQRLAQTWSPLLSLPVSPSFLPPSWGLLSRNVDARKGREELDVLLEHCKRPCLQEGQSPTLAPAAELSHAGMHACSHTDMREG